MIIAETVTSGPYLPALLRIALALAIGLFVGLERERRGKEAGVRTFAFAALLGCLGGLLGDAYALACLGLFGVLIVFLNWQRLTAHQTTELTTSVALMVIGVVGILCGKGQVFTPVAIGLVMAALLAWKERITHFSVGLTEAELRAAILLAILTFVVYPTLPIHALDRWNLIAPRASFTTVILIAAIGFVNYVLLKIYGSRGARLAGFLGGLVNSTVAVTELATRARRVGPSLDETTYDGVVLATAAMLVRNAIVVGVLALPALAPLAVPLCAMLVGCGLALARPARPRPETWSIAAADLPLESPFSLPSAIKFGLIFLAVQIAGTLAQRALGPVGFYAVSLAGGVVSSASASASAATLCAQGHLSPGVAANGAILASLSSVVVNLPLVYRLAGRRGLSLRLTRALGMVCGLGAVGVLLRGVAERWVP